MAAIDDHVKKAGEEEEDMTGIEGDVWLFDYMAGVMRSPCWDVPVMTFIDEHCIVFDSEEENKFSYSEIHAKFKVLIDNLLEQNLSAVGATEDQFFEACESVHESKGLSLSKDVLSHIMSVNDFLTFKKLMVKRNMELELEAVKALERNNGCASPIRAPVDAKEEEDQLAEALRLSKADAEVAKVAEEAKEAELQEILRATALEAERQKTLAKLQQAKLELEIAQTLQAEEDAIELAKAVVQKAEDTGEVTVAVKETSDIQTTSAAAAGVVVSEGKEGEVEASSPIRSSVMERREEKEEDTEVDKSTESGVTGADAFESKCEENQSPKKEEREESKHDQEDRGEIDSKEADTASPGPSSASPSSAASSSPLHRKTLSPMPRKLAPLSGTKLPPLSMKLPVGMGSALPTGKISIDQARKIARELEKEHATNRERVARDMELSRQVRQQAEEAAKKAESASAEEQMKVRMAHLQRQRQKLAEARRKKREAELEEYKKEQQQLQKNALEEKKKQGVGRSEGGGGSNDWIKHRATMHKKGHNEKEQAELNFQKRVQDYTTSIQRNALSVALARRMRSEVSMQSFDRRAQEQHRQFMVLDKQLEEAKVKRMQMREDARERAVLAQREKAEASLANMKALQRSRIDYDD